MIDDTNPPIIDVQHLSRRFGKKHAIRDATIAVPPGCVFGLLGQNGAGKTTLIKHLLGSLVAKDGSVRVLGRDPAKEPAKVLANVGYLSEDRIMPTWMRVHEYISFMSAFYPRWDHAFADELLETFQLDPQSKIRTLSRGERAKTGLLAALAHRPELLILDEPSSGLDVIVRHDILAAIVRNVASEGRTVFFSSHLLDEVERLCDRVAMMANGEIFVSDTLENIKANHSRVTIRLDTPLNTPPAVRGMLNYVGTERDWTLIGASTRDSFRRNVEQSSVTIVDERTPSLEEIFVAHSRSRGRYAATAPAGDQSQ